MTTYSFWYCFTDFRNIYEQIFDHFFAHHDYSASDKLQIKY